MRRRVGGWGDREIVVGLWVMYGDGEDSKNVGKYNKIER